MALLVGAPRVYHARATATPASRSSRRRRRGGPVRFYQEIDIVSTSAHIPVEQDDGRLIAATGAGDVDAFRVLVDRHSAALHRLAYRMLNDPAEAEDVVQEALVTLWDHAATWQARGGGAPAWLRRIVTNACLDRLRRRRRVADIEPPEQIDAAPGADRRVDDARLGDVAQRSIAALPDRQRAAIVLTYYEELSNAAAADLLRMKLKAFESLLFRARAALRDQVQAAGISAADLGEPA